MTPYSFDAAKCGAISGPIISQITAGALAVGARVSAPFIQVTCSASVIKICGSYFSSDDGAKMDAWFDTKAAEWREVVAGGPTCMVALEGYTLTVAVGGDGSNTVSPPTSCANAVSTAACTAQKVDFPKCKCNTNRGATPFAVENKMTTEPGRTRGTTLYCFTLKVVAPTNPDSPCGKTETLLKAEIYADDTKRQSISGIALQKAGESTKKFKAAVWGKVGEDTLKATPLQWTKAEANGAQICFELKSSTDIKSFCKGSTVGAPTDMCWINFFDDAKDCCPLYASTI